MTEPRPCEHCGMALFPDDRFCTGCGESTGPEVRPLAARRSSRIVAALNTGSHGFVGSCARCGGEVLPGDRYCQLCGAAQPPI